MLMEEPNDCVSEACRFRRDEWVLPVPIWEATLAKCSAID